MNNVIWLKGVFVKKGLKLFVTKYVFSQVLWMYNKLLITSVSSLFFIFNHYK